MEIVELKTLLEKEAPGLEETKNIYSYPIPIGTHLRGVDLEGSSPDGPSHVGPFAGAVDLLVDLGTPVLAALDGRVVQVVDVHDKYGPTRENRDFANFVTVEHTNGEFSKYIHLAQSSSLVKIGDQVSIGQQLAATGNSGWTTEPHLHFSVYNETESPPGFQGRKIRFGFE